MKINLAVLVEARECLKLLREYEATATPCAMQDKEEYMRCMRGYSAFNAELESLLKSINAEVEA